MGETPPRAPSPVGGVPESLLVLDGDLCVQDASLPFYAMFGVTPEQTLGRRLRELGDGQWDVPAQRELLEGLPAGDGTFDDYRVQRDFPNIGPATMLLKGRCLHKGDPTDWLILLGIRDVTDPPGAGRARAVSREALYESALAGICDAIIASDVQGRVSLLNPAAEAMTGWDRRQATGRPVAEVLRVLDERTRSPCDGPLVPAVLPDRWDGAGGHDVLVARDGTERAVERIADPIRDADGTVVGAVAVVRDVTRRR
jgi:PAS domain-containing protein